MSDVTNQDRKDLSKALGYANWSALGLIIPFVGWLLAGMALSFIKTIPETHETTARLKQVKRAAWLGIIISSLAVAAWGGYYKYNQSQEARRLQAVQQAENQKKEADTRKQKLAKEVLDSCIRFADSEYWAYVKLNATSQNTLADGRTTYYASEYTWDTASKNKKDEIDECYRKQQAGLFYN